MVLIILRQLTHNWAIYGSHRGSLFCTVFKFDRYFVGGIYLTISEIYWSLDITPSHIIIWYTKPSRLGCQEMSGSSTYVIRHELDTLSLRSHNIIFYCPLGNFYLTFSGYCHLCSIPLTYSSRKSIRSYVCIYHAKSFASIKKWIPPWLRLQSDNIFPFKTMRT